MQAGGTADARVPVTIVTGALGAGKTTLLNHLLTQTSDLKLAIVVNEFGDAGIDGDLIDSGAEDLIELSSGCICCVIRGDLIRTLRELLRSRTDLDGIVIETTGLANPAPVLQTFMADQILAGRCRLDGVVTVVDAIHIASQLARSDDAADQIAVADCIVLNKVSEAAAPQSVRVQLAGINPFATLIETDRGRVAAADILNRRGFDPARLADKLGGAVNPEHDHDHDHDHIESAGIASVTLRCGVPLDGRSVQNWLETLLTERGADILRTKGILDIAGKANRIVVQAVHMLIESDEIGPWRAGEARESRLVLIGRNLNHADLQAGFAACRAETVS